MMLFVMTACYITEASMTEYFHNITREGVLLYCFSLQIIANTIQNLFGDCYCFYTTDQLTRG